MFAYSQRSRAAGKKLIVGRSHGGKRGRFAALFTTLLLCGSAAFAWSENLHPQVQAALDYELTQHDCEFPRPKSRSSVGSERQLKRKTKAYDKCLKAYKADLLVDFESLRASAQHGLTQSQAETIAGKLKMIQLAVQSRFGLPMTDEQAQQMMMGK